MRGDPIENRAYAHWKGGVYFVVGVSVHTETQERLVVYRHTSGRLWSRPVDSWNSPAPTGGQRFTLLPVDWMVT